MDWRWIDWAHITPDELYDALKLRQDVFISEQNCIYPDMDDKDQHSLHLLARNDTGTLTACLRIVPPGVRYVEPSIGRLVVRPSARRRGLAREMMLEAIKKCAELYPRRTVRIQAQQYLEAFYKSLGFVTVTPPYDEDGIMHVEMTRAADAE